MKYTEGDTNLLYYLKHGTFPKSPIPKQRMGNEISDIVGTHYEGEQKPRQIQKLPLYNYYHSQRFAPTAIDIPTPFGQVGMEESTHYRPLDVALSLSPENTRLLMVGGLVLGLLILFGIVSF